LHTWKKKTKRARQIVSQGLGLSLGTVDEGFKHIYSQFRDLDAVTQSLLKNIAAYLSAVQAWHQCHVTACQSICEFYSDGAAEPAVVQYTDFQQKLLLNLNSQFTVRIEGLVLTPLKQLKSLFDAPNYLIEKRDHKLLDYDSWKNKVTNTQNKEKLAEYKEEMTMAGRMYEALNTQLLTDLPLLVNCGVKVVYESLAAFISAHRQHVAMARESIAPLMQCVIVKGPADSLVECHLSRLAIATERLVTCQCIPNSFLASVNLQQRKASSPKQVVRAGTMNVETTGLLTSAVTLPSNSPKSSRSFSTSPLLKEPQVQSADDCFHHVEFSFTANNVGELSVTEGDQVCVKQKHDESGSCEWWLIQFNGKEGFVPAAYLSPVCEDAYCVEYDFDGDQDGELSVCEGQRVRVKQKHDDEGNTDWWLCECDGKTGYIPSSYLTKGNVFY
jgi:amphiphysin